MGQPRQMQSQAPQRAGALWEETGKTGQRILAEGQDQGKSQEVGRTWEMAKEGRGGLPRAFRCFMGWGQG